MYILASFLIAGLICNLLVRPVNKKWLMSDDQVAALQEKASSALPSGPIGSHGIGFGGLDAKSAIAWLCVGVPLAWGVWLTLQSAIKIFS